MDERGNQEKNSSHDGMKTYENQSSIQRDFISNLSNLGYLYVLLRIFKRHPEFVVCKASATIAVVTI